MMCISTASIVWQRALLSAQHLSGAALSACTRGKRGQVQLVLRKNRLEARFGTSLRILRLQSFRFPKNSCFRAHAQSDAILVHFQDRNLFRRSVSPRREAGDCGERPHGADLGRAQAPWKRRSEFRQDIRRNSLHSLEIDDSFNFRHPLRLFAPACAKHS
mgnify:CR=1 FL=1